MISRVLIGIYIVSLFINPSVFAEKSGTINGIVIDGFGKPLDGVSVNVQINETNFKANTDVEGRYKVNYLQGNVKISYSKAGYTTIQLQPVNLSEITELNLNPVTLWKYPERGGLYLVSSENYEEIGKNALFAEKQGNVLKFFVKGNPTSIAHGDLTIMDYQDDNPLVIGKTLYIVHDNNLIGSLGDGVSGQTIDLANDEYIKIVDNVGLRILKLDSGRYFYSTATLTNRTRMAEGYFFEITNSAQSEE